MGQFFSAKIKRSRRSFVLLQIAGALTLVHASNVTAQTATESASAASVASSVAVATPKSTAMPSGQSNGGTGSPHITSSMTAPSPEVSRAALESKAGPDAAHLLLRSNPSLAQVWIDGKAVGNTPLLLIVAPGKYKVELMGAKQEHAESECALLPKETKEVVMNLQKLYPSRVVAH